MMPAATIEENGRRLIIAMHNSQVLKVRVGLMVGRRRSSVVGVCRAGLC